MDGTPFVGNLLKDGIVSDETMTHCIAYVSGVPYVNLADVPIDQKILSPVATGHSRAIYGGAFR